MAYVNLVDGKREEEFRGGAEEVLCGISEGTGKRAQRRPPLQGVQEGGAGRQGGARHAERGTAAARQGAGQAQLHHQRPQRGSQRQQGLQGTQPFVP